MRGSIRILLLVLLALTMAGCAFSLPGSGTGSNPPSPPPSDASLAEHVPGQVLVRLVDGAMADGAAAAVDGTVIREYEGLARIALPAGAGVADSRSGP